MYVRTTFSALTGVQVRQLGTLDSSLRISALLARKRFSQCVARGRYRWIAVVLIYQPGGVVGGTASSYMSGPHLKLVSHVSLPSLTFTASLTYFLVFSLGSMTPNHSCLYGCFALKFTFSSIVSSRFI